MAFSIEYLYQIADKFTAPLKKMEGAGGKFDDKLEQVQKSLALVENKMDSTSMTTKSLSTNMKSVGDGFNSKALAVRKSLGQIETSADSLNSGMRNVGNNFNTEAVKSKTSKFKRIIESAKKSYNKFNTALSKFGVKFNSRVTKIQSKLGGLQNKFKSTGEKMANMQTGLAAVGAGVFLKGALQESMAFQKSLNMTKAVTGSTTEQMEMMRSKALEWGSQTQFSSTQVASAMAELGKMGNKTNDILNLMPGTMALAAAGEISMAEAANFSMGILNQFSMELGQAQEVADILAAGASGAATSVTGLAAAMSNTGLDAKMAGLSIKDTTAALMAMATVNLEGAEAGTMFKSVLTEIGIGSSKVRKGFEKMGIDMDQFRDSTTGQITDLWGLIDAMKAGGANAAILGEMFGRQAKKGIGALLEADADKLNGFKKIMLDVGGASERMAGTLKEGLNPLIQFESVMGNLKVIVGGFVATALNPLLEKFNSWLGNIQQNNPEMLKMITYFLMGVTAVGAILVPLGLVISSIGSFIGIISSSLMFVKLLSSGMGILNAVMLANPVGLIVLGIAALIAIIILLVKHWDTVSAKLSSILDNPFFTTIGIVIAPWITMPALIIKHWDKIKVAIGAVWSGIKFFGEWISGTFTEIWTSFSSFMVNLWTTIGTVASAVWGGIKTAFTASINFIKAVFYTFADNLLSTYGNIFKTIIGLASKVGGALGLDTSGLDGMINKIENLQSTVRDKSLIGGSSAMSPYINGTPEAPIPGGNAGGNANANATVSVYAGKGVDVKPWEASGDLGYNMTDNYQRGM